MSVSDINVYSRTAGGVIVMRISDDTRIVTLSRLEKLEEIEEAEEKINEENKNLETAEVKEVMTDGEGEYPADEDASDEN